MFNIITGNKDMKDLYKQILEDIKTTKSDFSAGKKIGILEITDLCNRYALEINGEKIKTKEPIEEKEAIINLLSDKEYSVYSGYIDLFNWVKNNYYITLAFYQQEKAKLTTFNTMATLFYLAKRNEQYFNKKEKALFKYSLETFLKDRENYAYTELKELDKDILNKEIERIQSNNNYVVSFNKLIDIFIKNYEVKALEIFKLDITNLMKINRELIETTRKLIDMYSDMYHTINIFKKDGIIFLNNLLKIKINNQIIEKEREKEKQKMFSKDFSIFTKGLSIVNVLKIFLP